MEKKMEKYNREFTVAFRDVDSKDRMTYHAIVDCMQEIARNHASELGLAYEMDVHGYYWIVLRTKIQIHTFPMLGETIRMETYIEGLDKMYSARRFRIYNSEGEELGNILAYYLLMNQATQLPVRLRSLPEKEHLFANQMVSGNLRKLSLQWDCVEKTMIREAYSGDIDSNHHMNNAYYIRWITDMFSQKELDDVVITSIQIEYKKEITEGNAVTLVRGKDAKGNEMVMGTIGNDTICFAAVVESETQHL
ncbi:MAG: thioesterase [Eubacteriales bacterium]